MDCLPGLAHYWVLESAQQADAAGRKGVSLGICQYCNTQAEFRNSTRDGVPETKHLFLGRGKNL